MTLRQAIQKRAAKAFMVAIGSFVAMFIGVLLLNETPFEWMALLLLLPFAGAMFYLTWVLDCPKCHVRLGQAVVPIAVTRFVFAQYKHCPYCGVALDSNLIGL